jgi:hypothetical protein
MMGNASHPCDPELKAQRFSFEAWTALRVCVPEGRADLAIHAQVEAAREAFGNRGRYQDPLDGDRCSRPHQGPLGPAYLDEDAVLVLGMMIRKRSTFWHMPRHEPGGRVD